MDFNSSKKHLFLLTVFIISIVIGISMVVAIDTTNNTINHVIKSINSSDNEITLLFSSNTKNSKKSNYINNNHTKNNYVKNNHINNNYTKYKNNKTKTYITLD